MQKIKIPPETPTIHPALLKLGMLAAIIITEIDKSPTRTHITDLSTSPLLSNFSYISITKRIRELQAKGIIKKAVHKTSIPPVTEISINYHMLISECPEVEISE